MSNNIELYCCTFDSPLGRLRLSACGEALIRLEFHAGEIQHSQHPVLSRTLHWLEQYFSGIPVSPEELPLAPHGTDFQHRVWDLLLQIPYGTTVTYGTIARQISPKMSAQAVGNAVGANPVPLIIPCHRVVSANGIGGYSCGLELKQKLLSFESRASVCSGQKICGEQISGISL